MSGSVLARARWYTMLDTPTIVGGGASALAAITCTIGGDARWLLATEDRQGGKLPFSAYADPQWPPVLRLPEHLLILLYDGLGERGLQLAQVMSVGTCFAFLALGLRRAHTSSRWTALAPGLVLLGATTTFFIARLQLFSLPLFAALLLLLRSEARQPSRRIWLLIPLLALWSNLHGAALVGAAVSFAYLLLHRVRRQPAQSAVLALASLGALCLTPALANTPKYYVGVLNNELAREHVGLWARLDPTGSLFDFLLLACGVVLLAVALRARPTLWESVVLIALAAMTIEASRSGVWLLLFAIGAGAPHDLIASRTRHVPRWLLVGAVLAVAAVIAAAIQRGPLSTGADRDLVAQAVQASEGSAVVAEGVLGEQVALAGGCLWVSNPLDAFPSNVQRNYVRWSETGQVSLLPRQTRVVIVRRYGSPANGMAHDSDFRLIAQRRDVALYLRDVPVGLVCRGWSARHP